MLPCQCTSNRYHIGLTDLVDPDGKQQKNLVETIYAGLNLSNRLSLTLAFELIIMLGTEGNGSSYRLAPSLLNSMALTKV